MNILHIFDGWSRADTIAAEIVGVLSLAPVIGFIVMWRAFKNRTRTGKKRSSLDD